MCATGECSDCLNLADLDDDRHLDCLVCGETGTADDPIVEHRREQMHRGCVDAFEAETDGIPATVDEAETERVPVRKAGALHAAFWAMAQEERAVRDERRSRAFNRIMAVLVALAAAWGFAGCATTAPPVQVEEPRSLTAGPSVYSAPLAHDAPPELGTIVDTGSDDVSAEVATTTRTADVGEPDAAPEVTTKGGGLLVGGAR